MTHARPLAAWALLLVMMLATLPALPAAVAQDEPISYRLPLLFQSGGATDAPPLAGLESLLGDAVPNEPATFSGGFLARTSLPLAAPLVIVKEQAFHFRLPDGAAAGDVSGSYEVTAVTLVGDRIPLGRLDIAGSTGTPDDARPPVRNVTDEVEPWLESVIDRFGNDTARTGVAFAYGAACQSWTPARPFCSAIEGDYGWGNIRLCRGGAAVYRDTFRVVDEAQQNVTGVGVCATHAIDVANATAEDVDAAARDRDPGSLVPPPSEVDWRSVTFDATPPAAFDLGDGTFVLPEGVRIEARVSLTARTDEGAPAPLRFTFGHVGSPAGLVVRTRTPGTTVDFAHTASPIAEGVHTGRFRDPQWDVDHFVLDVPGGVRVDVRALAGGFFAALVSENGEFLGYGSAFVESPTRAILSVFPTGPSLEYRFALSYTTPPEPESDGRVVGEGTHAGTLGAGDDVDTFYVDMWRDQHAEFTLVAPEGASYGMSALGAVRVLASDAGALHVQATETGRVGIEIRRAYGSGAYTLAVDLDEGGDLARFPQLEPSWSPYDGTIQSALVPYAGAVEVLVRDRNWTHHRVRFDGASASELPLMPHTRDLMTHAAGGALVYSELTRGGSRLMLEPGPAPLMMRGESAVFGPDGALYVMHHDQDSRLARLHEDLTLEHIAQLPDMHAPAMSFSPDGTLYVTEREVHPAWPPEAFAFPIGGGTPIPAETLRGHPVFDASGAAYVVRNRTFVDRVDPLTHERTLVAWSEHPVREIAISGSRLFALLTPSWPQTAAGIASLDLGVAGFDGFHPAFDAAPAPDLVVAWIEDEVVGTSAFDAEGRVAPAEDHVVRVRVENVGGSRAGATVATAHAVCGVRCYALAERLEWQVPPLDPGEGVTLEGAWRGSVQAGDVTWYAWADAWWAVAEADDENNSLSLDSHVLVGGTREACALLDLPLGLCRSLT